MTNENIFEKLEVKWFPMRKLTEICRTDFFRMSKIETIGASSHQTIV